MGEASLNYKDLFFLIIVNIKRVIVIDYTIFLSFCNKNRKLLKRFNY